MNKVVRFLGNTMIVVATVLFGIALVCCALLLLDTAYHANLTDSSLHKWYLIGGIFSGVFAFGAFFVAVYATMVQYRTGRIQRFETTFFNMLSLHQQITNELVFTDTKKIPLVKGLYNNTSPATVDEELNILNIKGRELFRYSFEQIKHSVSQTQRVDGMKNYIAIKGLSYYDISTTPTYYDHYFRHLYIIIKFVKNSSFLKFEQAYKYTSMVRATLSRYELVWLYYNCLSGVGNQKFKPLLEEYSILKNIRTDLLALCKDNSDFMKNNGITTDAMEDEGFEVNDYIFFLSDKKGIEDSYYIGAFYSNEELHKGRTELNKWRRLISDSIRSKSQPKEEKQKN